MVVWLVVMVALVLVLGVGFVVAQPSGKRDSSDGGGGDGGGGGSD